MTVYMIGVRTLMFGKIFNLIKNDRLLNLAYYDQVLLLDNFVDNTIIDSKTYMIDSELIVIIWKFIEPVSMNNKLFHSAISVTNINKWWVDQAYAISFHENYLDDSFNNILTNYLNKEYKDFMFIDEVDKIFELDILLENIITIFKNLNGYILDLRCIK